MKEINDLENELDCTINEITNGIAGIDIRDDSNVGNQITEKVTAHKATNTKLRFIKHPDKIKHVLTRKSCQTDAIETTDQFSQTDSIVTSDIQMQCGSSAFSITSKEVQTETKTSQTNQTENITDNSAHETKNIALLTP